MIRPIALALLTGLLAGMAPNLVVAGEHDTSDYTVAELLGPCREGDNDARWGEVAELECEQYLVGFVDAFVLAGGDQSICLPPAGPNRADEIRWAFMKWAYDHFDQRDMPAAQGVMATLRRDFACP